MSVDLARRLAGCALAGCLACAAASPLERLSDPFGVDPATPRVPPELAAGQAGSVPCASEGPMTSAPVSLDEAVDRALCANPQTLESWLAIRVQAAALGESVAAWWPQVSAAVQRNRDVTDTRVVDHAALSSYQWRWYTTQSVLVRWTLLDFGKREADERSERRSLDATRAAHSATLLQVFSDIARDYFAAQAAVAAVSVAGEMERTARETREIVQARVDQGIAPVSDLLQARTALAEATLRREQAASTWLSSRGTLAAGMGRPPGEALALPPIEVRPVAEVTGGRSVDELVARAQDIHPSVLQGIAQLDAALARAASARAQWFPSLALNVNVSRSSLPVAPAVGASPLPTTTRDRSVALELSVPLFDGFAGTYRAAQAGRQAEMAQARLAALRQQVALDVWTAFQDLSGATRADEQAVALLAAAEESFAAASERYRIGVGSIVDLMAAQGALANARGRRLQARTDWQAATWRLATHLGVLDRDAWSSTGR